MYVYTEYPKCLYDQNGVTLTVENAEEEANAAAVGYMTAEQYHMGQRPEEMPSPEEVPPPIEEAAPASEEPAIEEVIPEGEEIPK